MLVEKQEPRIQFVDTSSGKSVSKKHQNQSDSNKNSFEENNPVMHSDSTQFVKFNPKNESFSNNAGEGDPPGGSLDKNKMQLSANKVAKDSGGPSSAQDTNSFSKPQDSTDDLPSEEDILKGAAGELDSLGKKDTAAKNAAKKLADDISKSAKSLGNGKDSHSKKGLTADDISKSVDLTGLTTDQNNSNNKKESTSKDIKSDLDIDDNNSTFNQLLKDFDSDSFLNDRTETSYQHNNSDDSLDTDSLDRSMSFSWQDSDSIINVDNNGLLNSETIDNINDSAEVGKGLSFIESQKSSNAIKNKKFDKIEITEKTPKITGYFEKKRTKKVTGDYVINAALQAMMNAGADAMSNLFDVYFVVNSNNSKHFALGFDEKGELVSTNDFDISKETVYALQKVMDPRILSTRIQNISIPGRLRDTFDLKIAGQSLTKPQTSFSVENKASISFRSDGLLVAYDFFNRLSKTGHSSFDFYLEDLGASFEAQVCASIPNMFVPQVVKEYQTVDLVVRRAAFKNMANFSWYRLYNSGNGKYEGTQVKPTAELSGRSQDVWGGTPVIRSVNSPDWEGNYSDKKNDFFVFRNIKMLGASSGLEFDRETSGPMNLTYDFIYKDLYRTTGSKFF